MRFRKNSWHYWVWKFTYAFKGEEGFKTPKQTSLCQYVGRIFLYPVPIALCIGFLIIVTGGVFFVLPNMVTILLGFGTLALGENNEVYYHHSFARLSVMGLRIPMWAVVCSTWLLVGLAVLIAFFPSAGTYAVYGVGGAMVVVLALYVSYLVVAIIVSACRRWEGWDVAKEYLKAKKQRLCPMITFDET